MNRRYQYKKSITHEKSLHHILKEVHHVDFDDSEDNWIKNYSFSVN